MTVSMQTTRLSSVITGCGGKDTTCSRRSISGRSRSTNGTRMVRPGGQGAAVPAEPLDDAGPGLRHDPHRLGQRDEHQQHDARRATPSATSDAHSDLRFVDDRRGAVDLHDLDVPPGLDDVCVGVVRRADQTSPLSLTRPSSASDLLE